MHFNIMMDVDEQTRSVSVFPHCTFFSLVKWSQFVSCCLYSIFYYMVGNFLIESPYIKPFWLKSWSLFFLLTAFHQMLIHITPPLTKCINCAYRWKVVTVVVCICGCGVGTEKVGRVSKLLHFSALGPRIQRHSQSGSCYMRSMFWLQVHAIHNEVLKGFYQQQVQWFMTAWKKPVND